MSRVVPLARSIDGRPAASDSPDWRAVLADAVTDPAELCRLLDLPPRLEDAARVPDGFRMLVPRPFVARMKPSDPDDPLLLQVLPQSSETLPTQGFSTDPVGDSAAGWGRGLLRKYRGRLLMVTTGACAVHCRFCFRRHFPYDVVSSLAKGWEGAVGQIAADSTIDEVVLSGGDPLMIDDPHLALLAEQLAAIPHVTRLRIHTRMPIVIPQRVTRELFDWLRGTRLTPVFVIHANHPAEIDEAVVAALGRLIDAGIPVLSQSVLLRRINDRVETLAELFRRLVRARVIPYYLHQLDRVAGAAHFEVSEEDGIRIVRELRMQLPGYAVPRYVRETPQGKCKEILA